MIRFLNFAHPLTAEQAVQLATLLPVPITATYAHMPQFDDSQPLLPQVTALLDGVGWETAAWQAGGLLVNLPGFAPAAACLLAEIHGRSGYFPSILRLRPRPDQVVRIFDVVEVINLAALREEGRNRR